MSAILSEVLTEMLKQSDFSVEHMEEIHRLGGRPSLDEYLAADIYIDCLDSGWREKCQFMLKLKMPIDVATVERKMGRVATPENLPYLAELGADINRSADFIGEHLRNMRRSDEGNLAETLSQMARHGVKAQSRHVSQIACDGRIPDRRDLIDILMKMGADLNALDDEGMSPLHHAIDITDIELIERLIDKGADPSLQEQFLHNDVTQCPALIYAITRTDPRYVEEFATKLIDLGCDPAATSGGRIQCDALGALVYRFALSGSYDFDKTISKDFVHLLMDKGCDINGPIITSRPLECCEHISPLMLCLIHRKYASAQMLIECGADINVPTITRDQHAIKEREHPLRYAVAQNNREMVDFILKNNPRIDPEERHRISDWKGDAGIKAYVEGALMQSSVSHKKSKHHDLGIGL